MEQVGALTCELLPVSFNRLDFIMYMILLIEIFKKAEEVQNDRGI